LDVIARDTWGMARDQAQSQRFSVVEHALWVHADAIGPVQQPELTRVFG
jgi:hypothetical protein